MQWLTLAGHQVPPVALSLPLFNRTQGENKKLLSQDKDREITYHLPSWANQTWGN